MVWRQKLIGRTRSTGGDQTHFPVQLELVPEKLSARVYLHDIDSRDGVVPCWTYVTNGLWAHKQKELIFSLRRNPEEKANDFPHAPLKFFVDVYRFAEQGQLVDVGDISELDTSNFLGRKGLLYISPESCQNIEGLEAALTAILLTEEELTAVKAFGPTRVMARLGQAYRYYPCPPWSDRTRPSLSFARSMQESILAQVPRLWIRGIKVRMENDLITLRLLPQVGEHVHNQLGQIPSNSPLALLTNLDPSAHGCLVWEPGQSQPSAITPPGSGGSRLCGCFILFIPEQSEDNGKLIEDGFMMMLTNASWMTIRQALAMGETVSMPATDKGMSFQLEWIQTSYPNPVDGAEYYAEGGWETYIPVGSRSQESGHPVNVKHIVLLTHEHDLGVRVGIEPFAAYTRSIEEVVRNHFVSFTSSDKQDLIAQFEVWPEGKAEIGLASHPGIANEILQNLYTSLLALPMPKVNQGSIKFQIVFTIQGSSDIA